MRIRDKAITIYSNGGADRSSAAKAGPQEQGVQRQYSDFLTEQRQKAAQEREQLLEQLRDPESEIYSQLQQKILEDQEKRLEQKREQATLDALSVILDSLSAKEPDSSSERQLTEAGAQLALNADPEELRRGYMPLELQVYLSVVTGRTAFQTVEPDEEASEAEKLRETEEARSADGDGLTEAKIGDLAETYNPRHMEQAEFLEFMDRLADMGALSRQGAEAVKNTGKWTVTVRDESGNVVEPLRWKNGEPLSDDRLIPLLFGEYSMEGDVLSWAMQASGNSDFRRLAEILQRMENHRDQSSSKITTAKI